jgi:glycosyltransferase involved in cell wall biosynthesis
VKGAALLDEVASLIEWPLLAAGPLRGPHGEAFTPGNMRSIGQLDDAHLHGLLAQRPIVVSAATFEPFGLAVLEAAMAGCAQVLSDIDTFRELWDGVAIFVDPTDAAGFAEAIDSLAADPARRQSLGKAAGARAARYTPTATAAKMRRIYAGVLEKRKIAA